MQINNKPKSTMDKFIDSLDDNEKKQFDFDYIELLQSELKLAIDADDHDAEKKLSNEIEKIRLIYKEDNGL